MRIHERNKCWWKSFHSTNKIAAEAQHANIHQSELKLLKSKFWSKQWPHQRDESRGIIFTFNESEQPTLQGNSINLMRKPRLHISPIKSGWAKQVRIIRECERDGGCYLYVSACADRLIVGRAVCAAGKVSVFLLCAPLMRVDSVPACAFSSQKTHTPRFWLDSRNLTRTVSHHLRYSLFLSIKLATFFIYLFVVCPWGLAPSVCLCVQGARLCSGPFS